MIKYGMKKKWILRRITKWTVIMSKKLNVWNVEKFKNRSKIVKNAEFNSVNTPASIAISLIMSNSGNKFSIVKAVAFVVWDRRKGISIAINAAHASLFLLKTSINVWWPKFWNRIVQFVWLICIPLEIQHLFLDVDMRCIKNAILNTYKEAKSPVLFVKNQFATPSVSRSILTGRWHNIKCQLSIGIKKLL